MLKIDMFSTADQVKGQGVGSVYDELMAMLKKYFPDRLKLEINRYNRADVSHYHTVNLPFYFSTFSKKRGRKVGFVHFLPETLDQSLAMPWLLKKIFYHYVIAFYKRMDQLVVVNPAFISKLAEYGIPESKVTYIPNFVSSAEFYPVSNQQKLQLRYKLGMPLHRFTVIGTGQIQTRKGVMDFVHLAKVNPEYQFIWVGGFSFGHITDGYRQLKKVVKNHPKNLSFPGIIDREKMVKYYNLADLFLLPSYSELFPMSVLEAFACGLPVLLRNLALYRSILKNDYLSFDTFSGLNLLVNRLAKEPNRLRTLQHKSMDASHYYSERRLAKIWYRFYVQQAKEGQHV